jgi:hypothetical protein
VRENNIKLATVGIPGDILLFKDGVYRKDDIRQQAIIFQPGMLGQDKFDFGVAEGTDKLIALIPAGDPAGGVAPDHMNIGFARKWKGVFNELVFFWAHFRLTAVPADGGIQDSIRN